MQRTANISSICYSALFFSFFSAVIGVGGWQKSTAGGCPMQGDRSNSGSSFCFFECCSARLWAWSSFRPDEGSPFLLRRHVEFHKVRTGSASIFCWASLRWTPQWKQAPRVDVLACALRRCFSSASQSQDLDRE